MTTYEPPKIYLELDPATRVLDLTAVKITAGAVPASIGLGFDGTQVVNVPPYTGAYEVTPSPQTQTLSTNGKRMTDDVIVNPIPSNYGLITWDGSVITVS